MNSVYDSEFFEIQNIMEVKSFQLNDLSGEKGGQSVENEKTRSKIRTYWTLDTSPLYRQWSIWFVPLRLLGSCPLILKRTKCQQGSELIFRWISWPCLWAVFSQSIQLLICIWYFNEWPNLFPQKNPEEPSLLDWIIRSLKYSIPLHHFLNIIAIWATGNELARLANSWINFELMFREIFGRPTGEYYKSKQWFCTLGILFIAVLTGIVAGTVGELVYKNYEFGYYQLLRLLLSIGFVCGITTEDTRVLLSYFTIAECFRYVRFGIEHQLNEHLKVSQNVVDQWTRSLLAVRDMVKQIGNIQALYLIPVFVHTVIILTGLLFMGITSLVRGHGIRKLFLVLVVGSCFVIRLILRIIMAESIYKEEEAITELLLGRDSKAFDLNGRLELSKLLGMLQQKPSKISLGGYMTVQKKLLTKMMTHILGYLLVLIQFDHSCSCAENMENKNDTLSL